MVIGGHIKHKSSAQLGDHEKLKSTFKRVDNHFKVALLTALISSTAELISGVALAKMAMGTKRTSSHPLLWSLPLGDGTSRCGAHLPSTWFSITATTHSKQMGGKICPCPFIPKCTHFRRWSWNSQAGNHRIRRRLFLSHYSSTHSCRCFGYKGRKQFPMFLGPKCHYI